MEPGNLAVFELLNPLCRLEDPIAQGNEEMRDSPIVLDISVRGAFEYVLIVLDMIVEPADLFLEAMDFDVSLGIASSNGCEEPFCNGLKDVGIEVRVCCQCGRNGTGRHRWFQTLDRANWERNTVFSGRGV